MNCLILKASQCFFYEFKVIHNLQDLLNIYDSLIIDFSPDTLDLYRNDGKFKNQKIDIVITIYDDYVE